MQTLKDMYAKLEGAWETVWTWVATHPKTTAIIALALVAANLARKY